MNGELASIGPKPRDYVPELDEKLEALLGETVSLDFREEARRMPPIVRQLLLECTPPGSVDPEALLEDLCLPHEEHSAALGVIVAKEGAVVRKRNVLSPAACAKLRAVVDAGHRAKIDTVDGAPDHQVNLNEARLEALVGAEGVEALCAIAGCVCTSLADARIFVRRYSVDTRPWIPFHMDTSDVTINVALGSDSSFEGGTLLCCYDGAVRAVERVEGEATVHSSTLLHGVTRMVGVGVRHSLIVFVGKQWLPTPVELTLDAAEREAEARELRALLDDPAFSKCCTAAVCGSERLEALLSFGGSNDRIGDIIAAAILRCAAPYLRPTRIRARAEAAVAADSGPLWSLRSLLGEMGYCCGEDFTVVP